MVGEGGEGRNWSMEQMLVFLTHKKSVDATVT